MDEIARYNRERWQALNRVDALFTRPKLKLDTDSARELLDSAEDFQGKRVLCLAGGGGQQSAAYALLGAEVTVVDLSPEQLAGDHEAAAHYRVKIQTHEGDMRDLSMLPGAYFDLVDQPYSLNFVPDAREVFAQVAKVIKPGGVYQFMCANPFAAGLTERDWNGTGYTVSRVYQQGERLHYEDQAWVYDRDAHGVIPRPQEFRQTLSTLLNGLTASGFTLAHFAEVTAYDASAESEPGTWEHFTAIIPPCISIRAVYRG